MVDTADSAVLHSLFNGVLHDLKASQNNWDGVVKSASKLSVQLTATASALAAFIDQIQIVGDSANNVKGSSRDIGASLTRFCMRQRSIENQVKSAALALTEQFCGSMDRKGDEWRRRVTDIERRRSKCFKKSKQKKMLPSEVASEQQEGCLELLYEQRNQFSFFVNALLPVLDIEVNILGECDHVKQVRDSMEQLANGTDPTAAAYRSFEDFCLNTDRRMISPAQSIISSTPSSGLDRTISPSIESFYAASRCSTISQSHNPYATQRSLASVKLRAPISRPPSTFTESSPARSSQAENVPANAELPPPGNGSAARRQRPLSFSGCEFSSPYDDTTLRAVGPGHQSVANTPGDRTSAALIAETLHQIDQLGAELDSYCLQLQSSPPPSHPGDSTSSGVGSSVVSSLDSQRCEGAGLIHHYAAPGMSTPLVSTPPTFRPSSATTMVGALPPAHGGPCSSKRPPPPPERRNSTIQTAHHAAPSIADLRTIQSDYASLPFQNRSHPHAAPSANQNHHGSGSMYGSCSPLPPPPAYIRK